MAKPEFEFTPTSSVDFAPCNPHIDGLSEAILARDSDNDSVTRILKFEPGTDTSPLWLRPRPCEFAPTNANP